MNYIEIYDDIPTFIPKQNEVKFIILGTMASSCARNILGKMDKGPFYYQSNRNSLWRILAQIYNRDASFLAEVQQRKDFLERHGIAMANLVRRVGLLEKDIRNSADGLLFDAFEDKENQRFEFKKIEEDFKLLLNSKPVFFTCLEKPRLTKMLDAYFIENQLVRPQVQFLPTPTRCSVIERSKRWLELGIK